MIKRSKNNNFQLGHVIAIPYRHHSSQKLWYVEICLIDNDEDEYEVDYVYTHADDMEKAAMQAIYIYNKRTVARKLEENLSV